MMRTLFTILCCLTVLLAQPSAVRAEGLHEPCPTTSEDTDLKEELGLKEFSYRNHENVVQVVVVEEKKTLVEGASKEMIGVYWHGEPAVTTYRFKVKRSWKGNVGSEIRIVGKHEDKPSLQEFIKAQGKRYPPFHVGGEYIMFFNEEPDETGAYDLWNLSDRCEAVIDIVTGEAQDDKLIQWLDARAQIQKEEK